MRSDAGFTALVALYVTWVLAQPFIFEWHMSPFDLLVSLILVASMPFVYILVFTGGNIDDTPKNRVIVTLLFVFLPPLGAYVLRR